jgi:hypothetical protein
VKGTHTKYNNNNSNNNDDNNNSINLLKCSPTAVALQTQKHIIDTKKHKRNKTNKRKSNNFIRVIQRKLIVQRNYSY